MMDKYTQADPFAELPGCYSQAEPNRQRGEISMRDLSVVERLPHGESIVGIVEFKGTVIVATSRGVWRLAEDKRTLVPIRFADVGGEVSDEKEQGQ